MSVRQRLPGEQLFAVPLAFLCRDNDSTLPFRSASQVIDWVAFAYLLFSILLLSFEGK